ncbi:glycosyl hydrolase family 32 domain protein [Desulfococcus multivorans]|uniref:Glycosyl hydrolase family 32 domain protein n=1 Tax=Desulfococcus multivorans DSM 2059 TaxID=1121405 RepID=S7TKX4_DESML|nr:glycosyl hydrolase family 32 domain protein [Desulfococcus multivorans]AOY57238.1 conserved uncharacterized protein [Desulfococcus multivorans]AQU99700.1 hypothetical protein B2D07_02175 [Desulfococcus multivorans]EPR37270.1 Glycosyl hydrolase family 32 domain protein [Desulfococcus multivorans DSM 2059]SKA25982.1 Glycosyl hydrolases family 32 N-terminal domain-containing protein [Desulfococcus multivorans DSM 2059]
MKPKIVKPGWEKDYFFGDFWYIFEPSDGTFHLFIQCMEKGSRWVGKYSEVSRVAYAVTRDFEKINYIAYDLIESRGDRYSSIWNSCIVYRHSKKDFLTFYTERTTWDVDSDDGQKWDYWACQEIKIAKSTGLLDWHIETDLKSISPEALENGKKKKYFRICPHKESCTVHAWRDPHVFHAKDKYYMLVAAKKKNAAERQNATIAMLEAEDDKLEKWRLAKYHDGNSEPIMLSPTPGKFVGGNRFLGGDELEVPQIYNDLSSNEIVVLASTAHPEDYQLTYYRGYNPWNNLPPSANVRIRGGYLIALRYKDFDSLFNKKYSPKHEIIAGPTSGLYACRVIPELEGHIVGFDVKNGVPRLRGGAQLANLDYLTEQDRSLHIIPALDRAASSAT